MRGDFAVPRKAAVCECERDFRAVLVARLGEGCGISSQGFGLRVLGFARKEEGRGMVWMCDEIGRVGRGNLHVRGAWEWRLGLRKGVEVGFGRDECLDLWFFFS